jgi:CDP-diacylglycerol---serine O-phosphatidyltransferase
VNRAERYGWAANAATAANALLGAGAIAYTLAGNPRFALLLIVGAIGFDGLDGILFRRGGGAPRLAGRVADSVADSISFGLAPGILIAFPTFHFGLWAAYRGWAELVGIEVAALAIARLVLFTWRGHARDHFVGASTPQTALAVTLALLFLDVPGFLGTRPVELLLAVGLLAPLMVLPVPYPKVRRGSALRWPMTATSVALAFALVPLQWDPAPGSTLGLLAEAAATIGAVGLAAYYVGGPLEVRAIARPAGSA